MQGPVSTHSLCTAEPCCVSLTRGSVLQGLLYIPLLSGACCCSFSPHVTQSLVVAAEQRVEAKRVEKADAAGQAQAAKDKVAELQRVGKQGKRENRRAIKALRAEIAECTEAQQVRFLVRALQSEWYGGRWPVRSGRGVGAEGGRKGRRGLLVEYKPFTHTSKGRVVAQGGTDVACARCTWSD